MKNKRRDDICDCFQHTTLAGTQTYIMLKNLKQSVKKRVENKPHALCQNKKRAKCICLTKNLRHNKKRNQSKIMKINNKIEKKANNFTFFFYLI